MGDFIIDVLNYIIEGLGSVLGWIVDLFPDTPFTPPDTPPGGVNLGWITWLIDFPTMIVHGFYLTSAITIYYGIRVVARWAKAVRN